MPRLQTPPSELKPEELQKMLDTIAALLTAAAYRMYDQAIAETVEGSIRNANPQENNFGRELEHLQWRQKCFGTSEMPLNRSWVEWATETNDNWQWLRMRYGSLRDLYWHHFKQEPASHSDVWRLVMDGPRPRPPGRTAFPEEPC